MESSVVTADVKDEASNVKAGASNGCAFLGEGVKFKGSISVPEKITVHGTLEGDVESRDLFVGPNGVIKGSVHVDQADVEGTIIENIEAKVCLSLRKSGRIEGKAVYGEIEIEKGGKVSGEVRLIDEASKGKLPPVELKTAGERGQGGAQLRAVPGAGAAGKSEAKPQPDAAKVEAGKQDIKSRPLAAAKSPSEARKDKDGSEQAEGAA
ncbi:MAG TPA: polymer-forming cytoskeletal protein [Xanthobacteraceae bacterium]|nr:polymer-forming cytoskeletal protein [Xanthobacteraceae bacterium]